MNDTEAAFFEIMRTRLTGSEDAREVARLTAEAGSIVGLAENSVQVVIDALKQEVLPTVGAEVVPTNPRSNPPTLLVNWGQDLCVGHQVCPEFSVLGCNSNSFKPYVEVVIDNRLDHDSAAREPRLTPDGDDSWTFDVPFSLTSGGVDCRPGRYKIEILLAFRPTDRPDLSTPCCFSCTIRLNVGDSGSMGGPTLEIEGDGQSVVNLQGGDLNRFSRVKLKGADTSIVNFQNSSSVGDASEPVMVSRSESESRLCEYHFLVDEHRQRLLPVPSQHFRQRCHLRSAAFMFDSGERVLLLARAKAFFGRAKTNDVVTRFLPRNEYNDNMTRDISRRHFSLELTMDGLLVSDLSSTKGVALSGTPVAGSRLLTSLELDEDIELHASASPSRQSFGFQIKAFSPCEEDTDVGEWKDFVCCDTLRCRQPKLWSMARSSGIDSVRLKRIRNLAENEQYVLIARQALIGFSEDAPIYIPDPRLRRRHARVVHIADGFWLENLADKNETFVDDCPIEPRELVPLIPGMKLTFAGTQMRFQEMQQSHVDG